MPSRILRNWIDSRSMDGISADAEQLFVRLIMLADDYGRYNAETRRVKAACFPLHPDLRSRDIDDRLKELEDRRLIFRYKARGLDLLAIPRFRQRLKLSKAKFDQPPGKPGNWTPPDPDEPISPGGTDPPQSPGSSGNSAEVPGNGEKIPPVLVLGSDLDSEAGGNPPDPLPPPPAANSRSKNGDSDEPDGLEDARALAYLAFNQWGSCAPPLGIRRPMNEAADEHRGVAELVLTESQNPPIIENGKQIQAHLLIPRAVEVLMAKQKQFKGIAYAVGCVKRELGDWRNGVGALTDDPVAQGKRVAAMHKQQTGAA